MDQWYRTEGPGIKTYIYGQLIFNKSAKTIQWGKSIFFLKQIVLGQLDILICGEKEEL